MYFAEGIAILNINIMRNLLTLIFGGLLLCGPVAAQTDDQQAIKQVCYDESMAYHARDFEKWASYHVQSADEQLTWNNPDGSFGFDSGWAKIGAGMKDWFQNAKPEQIRLTNSNFVFVIRGDMAFIAYDSDALNAEDKTVRMRENRTLLRVDGKWKVLAVQAYANHLSGK